MIWLTQIITTIFAIDLNWKNITDPIYELFMGNQTMNTTGIFGDELLLGVFIFFIFMILTLMFGLGMLLGSVILVPATFAIFDLVPNLRIIIAIMLGLLFGIGLNQLIRR